MKTARWKSGIAGLAVMLMAGSAWGQEGAVNRAADLDAQRGRGMDRNFLEFRVEAEAWFSELDGEIRVDDGSTEGTRIDFREDLNIDTDETSPGATAMLRFGRNRLNFRYARLEYEGEQTITRQITFGPTTFTATERVKSEFELEIFEGNYERTLPFWPSDRFQLNVLGGVFVVDFEGEMESSTRRREESFTAPIPVVGLASRFRFPYLDLFASAKGMTIDSGEVDGDFLDAMGGVSLNWWILTISGGYRYTMLDLESDDIDVDIEFQGPYVSAGFRF